MKSTQFTIDFLEQRKKNFVEPSFRQYLPIKPYQDVLDDLERLKLTESILSTKSLHELIKVLKTVNYLYIPEPTPTSQLIFTLENIAKNLTTSYGFLHVISPALKNLPSSYGLKAKVYELVYGM